MADSVLLRDDKYALFNDSEANLEQNTQANDMYK